MNTLLSAFEDSGPPSRQPRPNESMRLRNSSVPATRVSFTQLDENSSDRSEEKDEDEEDIEDADADVDMDNGNHPETDEEEEEESQIQTQTQVQTPVHTQDRVQDRKKTSKVLVSAMKQTNQATVPELHSKSKEQPKVMRQSGSRRMASPSSSPEWTNTYGGGGVPPASQVKTYGKKVSVIIASLSPYCFFLLFSPRLPSPT